MKRIFITLCLLPLLGGCAGQSVPADWISADRATYEAVVPEYSGYVARDDKLSAADKGNRQRTLDSWRLRIEAHEAATKAGSGQ